MTWFFYTSIGCTYIAYTTRRPTLFMWQQYSLLIIIISSNCIIINYFKINVNFFFLVSYKLFIYGMYYLKKKPNQLDNQTAAQQLMSSIPFIIEYVTVVDVLKLNLVHYNIWRKTILIIDRPTFCQPICELKFTNEVTI